MGDNDPKCKGVLWDAVSVPQCAGCGINLQCKHFFATDVLRILLGEDSSVSELAEVTKVTSPSIQEALKYLKHVNMELPKKLHDEVYGCDPAVEGVVSAKGSESEVVVTKKVSKKSNKKGAKKGSSPSTKKKVSKKTSKKRSAQGNAVVEESEPAENPVIDISVESQVQDPQMAESVQPAMDSVRTNKAACVRGVADLDEKLTAKQLTQWIARNTREKLRNPWIRLAVETMEELITFWPRGSKLMHRVQLLPNCYRYHGIVYPTLYMVAKVIQGVRNYPKPKDPLGKRPKGTRKQVMYNTKRMFLPYLDPERRRQLDKLS